MTFFDSETAVTQTDNNCWQGFVHGQWNIGDNPNGGYMVSIVIQVLRAVLPHADPLTLTTHFLRPGLADAPCEVRIEVVRTGRSMSTARGTLLQEGKERIVVLAGFGNLDDVVGVDEQFTQQPPQLPPPDQCVTRSGEAQGVALPLLERLHIQLHPQQALAGQAGAALVSGWIRFADGQEPDSGVLPLFADAFPPSPFGLLGVVGWVPTVELTVHVRARPAPGWICARFACTDLLNGRMIEDGQLWDSNGQLVARSRQIGLVMVR